MSNINPPSIPPTTPSLPQTTASNYANKWCEMIIGETSNCQAGSLYAQTALQSNTSPSDISNACTNVNATGVQMTDGYRYGCYLTTVFSGDSSNFQILPNGTINNQNYSNIPVVSSASCNNVFSSSGDITACQSTYNSVAALAPSGSSALSCAEGLGMGSPNDPTVIPTVVGCTLGQAYANMAAQLGVQNNNSNGSGNNSGGSPNSFFPLGNAYNGPATDYESVRW